MKIMDAAITPIELKHRLAAFPPPTLIDVRRQPAFEQDPDIIPGALRRLPETVDQWAGQREPWGPVGVHWWRAEDNQTRPFAPPTRWVTRARPKIDRIACPWLVRRFIDPAAEFFYVPTAEVRRFAAENGATPYDVPDVRYTHAGRDCSFDAFIRLHGLDHPALAVLATIVRGADTGAPELAREASGLLAVSLGLSATFADDHEMLKWGMLVYDSLYAWCREAQTETHGWYPEKLRAEEHA